jgi:hypothetical protein
MANDPAKRKLRRFRDQCRARPDSPDAAAALERSGQRSSALHHCRRR